MKLDTKELKTITILYVEDDTIVRRHIKQALEKIFLKVFVGVNGEEGFEIFKENQEEIDVVISDINMPIRNGLDMIKDINELNNSIPTIITTAHTDSSLLLDAIAINIDKYIFKPIQIKELTVSIVTIVRKYRKLKNIEKLAKSLVTKSSKDDNINSTLTNKVDMLERENNYYKAIIDNLVITFKTDKNANITEVSDKFLRFFGFDKEHIVGESINKIECNNTNQESFQKLMLKAIHAKKTIVSTYVLQTNNNESVKCDMTLSPQYNEESLISGYTVYLDILH